MGPQHRERIVQMLQHVAIDHAVERGVGVERQRVGFHVHRGDVVEPAGGDVGALGVALDAEQPGARVAGAVGGEQRAGAAADIQHRARGERDALQQVGIEGLRRRVGIGHVGLRQGGDQGRRGRRARNLPCARWYQSAVPPSTGGHGAG